MKDFSECVSTSLLFARYYQVCIIPQDTNIIKICINNPQSSHKSKIYSMWILRNSWGIWILWVRWHMVQHSGSTPFLRVPSYSQCSLISPPHTSCTQTFCQGLLSWDQTQDALWVSVTLLLAVYKWRVFTFSCWVDRLVVTHGPTFSWTVWICQH